MTLAGWAYFFFIHVTCFGEGEGTYHIQTMHVVYIGRLIPQMRLRSIAVLLAADFFYIQFDAIVSKNEPRKTPK